MAQSVSVLPFDEFTNGVLDSLSWYDLVSGDILIITGCPPLSTCLDTDISVMTRGDFLHHAQVLSAQLLSGTLSINLETAKRLAFQASQVMSRELCATGDRAQRMWAQRLNYALQPLIALAEPPPDLSDLLSEEMLEGKKPWDALRLRDTLWWLSSDKTNFHCRTSDNQTGMTLPLPTQIDPLPDKTLSVGSIYSNGSVLISNKRCERIIHDAPILLVFDWDGARYFLDTHACIWSLTSRQLIHKVPCKQVHFARVFNGTLYLLDNGDFGHITYLSLSNGHVFRQSVLPVQVCNDIVVTSESIYLIDKQQGSIFAFNLNWQYRTRRLSFGVDNGQLCDPVSLRLSESELYCVSWLTSKLSTVRLF